MKFHAKLLSTIFLLGVIRNVIPSNPDSEIVQDATEDSNAAGKMSMPIRSAGNRPIVAVVKDRDSGLKVLQPYYTATGIIWKEVGLSSGNDKIRIRDRGEFVDILRVMTNNRKTFAVPADDGDLRQDATSPSVPLLPPSNSAPRSNGFPGRTLSNPPNVDDSRSYSGQVPNGQANRNYEYVPYGSRVPTNAGARVEGQNRETPVTNWNVPRNRESRKNATASHSGGNRTPAVPQQPQNVRGGESPSAANHKSASPDSNLFAGIVNDFAFKLVETLNLNSNFVISPLSIFVALSMCYLGAEGRTKAQLEQVLGLNEFAVHGVHLHQGISDLLSMISPESDEYQLFLANGLFLGRNIAVEQPFREEVQKFYGAELKNLDFSKPQISLRAINQWVSMTTRNTIMSLIDNPLPASTTLALLNAIFFKGIWKTQFPLDFTYNGQFFSSDGSEKEVPFMNLYRETFPIFRSDEHRHSFIKLPYKGDQVSMIIALPYTREERPMPVVTDKILCHVKDAMQEQRLNAVSIPKFRLESLSFLRQSLTQLGISDIFGRSANMSKMRRQKDVFVSNILHKAVVDVNEEGTTASASTSVQILPLTSSSNDFEANHPFAFYIVHEASGLVLFHGKIYDLGESVGGYPNNGRESRPAPPGNM